MRLLVLGGIRFVGRALLDAGVDRGWEVAALNRGGAPDGVEHLRADRTDPRQVREALRGREFDLVVDTWAEEPTDLSAVHADRWAYVSSRSVYRWGAHTDESSPLVEVDEPGYAGVKLRGERAAPDGALLLRAGLVLGPHEDVGRLPWWLLRCARGGRVVAPGRPERPLQHVDARDLAAFALDALVAGHRGPVDLTSPSGHATTRSLLQACVEVTGGGAELVWIPEDELGDAEPWTQLPCWAPEGGAFAGFMEGDVSRALAWGLRCRPVEETVRDTWAWLQEQGPPPQRPDRPVHGLPPALEAQLLAGR